MAEEPTTAYDLVQLSGDWFEAVANGDHDRMLSFLGPEPVWDMSPMGMTSFEGPAAIRGFLEEWMGMYEDFRIEAEEICDLGNGVIFCVVLQRGRPMGSGGTVSLRYGSCAVWVGGKAVHVCNYPDVDECRAAAERLAEERE